MTDHVTRPEVVGRPLYQCACAAPTGNIRPTRREQIGDEGNAGEMGLREIPPRGIPLRKPKKLTNHIPNPNFNPPNPNLATNIIINFYTSEQWY